MHFGLIESSGFTFAAAVFISGAIAFFTYKLYQFQIAVREVAIKREELHTLLEQTSAILCQDFPDIVPHSISAEIFHDASDVDPNIEADLPVEVPSVTKIKKSLLWSDPDSRWLRFTPVLEAAVRTALGDHTSVAPHLILMDTGETHGGQPVFDVIGAADEVTATFTGTARSPLSLSESRSGATLTF